MRKNIIAALLPMAGMFGAYAADEYLHVETAAGWKVVNIDNVSTLSFKGGTMEAKDANGKSVMSIPCSELKTMKVAATDIPSGVISVESDAEGVPFVFSASEKCVRMITDGKFEIFDLSGNLLVSIPEVRSRQIIDINDVSAGVVIMKSGEYSIKTVVK